MSLMCSMSGECKSKKGMCGHEKMMLGIVVMGILGGVSHWGLHLF